MYYFYVLKSEKDNKYYYGSCVNLKNRMNEHLKGFVASTKYRRPLNLVYYEAYLFEKSARLREKQVKSSGNARKTLLEQNQLGPIAQLVRAAAF